MPLLFNLLQRAIIVVAGVVLYGMGLLTGTFYTDSLEVARRACLFETVLERQEQEFEVIVSRDDGVYAEYILDALVEIKQKNTNKLRRCYSPWNVEPNTEEPPIAP